MRAKQIAKATAVRSVAAMMATGLVCGKPSRVASIAGKLVAIGGLQGPDTVVFIREKALYEEAM